MTSREFSDRVRRRARRAGVHVSGALLEQLETYFRLLDTWNAKINLTALDLQRDPDNAVDRLLIEPLAAVRHLDAGAARVIDIGSGGGSPAIPMKLARPEAAFTLVESKTRKCAFLREAGRQLKIDLRVETARYEMLLSRPEFHEGFDALTMRAVRVESGVLVESPGSSQAGRGVPALQGADERGSGVGRDAAARAPGRVRPRRIDAEPPARAEEARDWPAPQYPSPRADVPRGTRFTAGGWRLAAAARG